MSQPIIISQGTFLMREEFAEKFVRKTFSDNSDYKSHIDFKSYEVADNTPNKGVRARLIPIEQIRDLIKEINIKPRISNKKIIWIKEAQNLSIEAQNAMLKTLEESPEYAQIILTVDHHDNLIKTIVSRCILKDLNLSVRINLDSQEYENIKTEFLNLLSMETGTRIDWVYDNKIKDRDQALHLLNNWEAVLREKMLESVDSNSKNAENYKNKIQLLQKVKKYIEWNANVSLAIEALLINL